jgi:hypothetical protein
MITNIITALLLIFIACFIGYIRYYNEEEKQNEPESLTNRYKNKIIKYLDSKTNNLYAGIARITNFNKVENKYTLTIEGISATIKENTIVNCSDSCNFLCLSIDTIKNEFIEIKEEEYNNIRNNHH